MSFYLVHPEEGEPPGWVATVHPADSLDVYVWVPALDRFVYDADLSGEFGYPMTEVVFEPISADHAATLVADGQVGRRDGRTFKFLLEKLKTQERTLDKEEVLPGPRMVGPRERARRTAADLSAASPGTWLVYSSIPEAAYGRARVQASDLRRGKIKAPQTALRDGERLEARITRTEDGKHLLVEVSRQSSR